MKPTNRELNQMLDDALTGIRKERISDDAVQTAADRVWRRLANEDAAAQAGVAPVEHIRGCEDFQALIPAYIGGFLTSARAMLLEDHSHECIPCRKALKEARASRRGEARPVRPVAGTSIFSQPAMRWAMAAVIAVGFGLFAWPWVQQFTRSIGTLHTIVQASQGGVYRVAENSAQPVASGAQLKPGERIRTAKDAKATIQLADGSQIEMDGRSELYVREGGEGTTIHLERGQIIVEAAKQDSKHHLFVRTEDSLVSVKGTIFSVNAGTKGSRVSVVEGEVHVDGRGQRSVLRPGDQVATHASITRVPVRDEVRWSANAEKYARVLGELEALRKQIDASVVNPGVRYSTRLLDLAPENTVLYVAIPNISQTLAEANRLLEEKISHNAELREWWQKEESRRRGGFNKAIDQVRELGAYLGPEIVVAASLDAKGEPGEPVVLAELINEAGFETYLRSKLAEIRPEGRNRIHLVTNAAELPVRGDGKDDFFIAMQGDVIAASPNPTALARVAGAVRTPESRFASSPFRAQLAELYHDGVGLLIAADLSAIFPQAIRRESAKGDESASAMEKLGLSKVQYFIAELKEKDGRPSNRAVLSFSENRGMASWLSAPGPMGALQFISPEATAVAAFVVERPVSLVDDLFGALQTADPKAWQELKDFESKQGLSLRDDFAAPLGGEFAFAVDGPMLPIPAWKAVVEVNDPERLQQSFESTVARLNEYAAAHEKKGFSWIRAESGDRVFHTLKSLDVGVEACYTFAYGYLVAAPTRALVERALQYRESSVSLLNAPRFKAALPEDRQANFSAMFYYDLTSVAGAARRFSEQMPSGPAGALKSVASSKPMLAYLYAQEGRFTFSVNTEDGPVGLTPSMLLGLPGPFSLNQLVQ
ncbi:MAG: FecR domain-containing protein [Acidobacteria bacterium]|nr:FecR domain-containing protein [Acidobacteriota bacterium]MCW5969508.1 FecR domain-containing protein [Blastocatellales bacterium]